MIEISGFPNYFVYDDGRIWSSNGNGRFLKPSSTNDYLEVNLYNNGKSKTKRINILVCEAFHGPRPKGMQAAHINGVKTDNRSENLMWKTPEENYADRVLHGTDTIGENNGNSKLNEQQINEIRGLFTFWHFTQVDIATIYGVTSQTIYNIINYRTWKD